MNSLTLVPRKQWRDFLSSEQQTLSPKIAVIGTYTLDSIIPFLGAALLSNGFLPKITEGPYNQIFQVCANFQSVLETDELDVIAIFWSMEDLIGPELRKYIQTGESDYIRKGSSNVIDLLNATKSLTKHFSGMVVMTSPMWPLLF